MWSGSSLPSPASRFRPCSAPASSCQLLPRFRAVASLPLSPSASPPPPLHSRSLFSPSHHLSSNLSLSPYPSHAFEPLLALSHINQGPLRRRQLPLVSRVLISDQVSSSMVEEGYPLGDKLVVRGLTFHGFHGVKAEEKKIGTKFLIDVDAWLDLQKAGESDALADTVSYTEIYRIIRDIVEGHSHNLLESVAHQIAMTTFEKHPQISAIRVKIGKPHIAIPSTMDYLGIEILRHNKKV